MGGMVAQELALAHPERIRTLTLGATYCGGPEGTLMAPEDVQLLGAAIASGDRERVFRAMWEINLSPTFREDDSRFAAFREMATALPAPQPVILQQMRACGVHDTSARLGEISTPTLVVHGTADRLLGAANGRQIAAPALQPGWSCWRASATCSGGSSRSAPRRWSATTRWRRSERPPSRAPSAGRPLSALAQAGAAGRVELALTLKT